jgi:hypothetical protein
MPSCYSNEVAKFIPFCNKDQKGKEAEAASDKVAEVAVDKKPAAFDCLKQNTSKACDSLDNCSWYVISSFSVVNLDPRMIGF